MRARATRSAQQTMARAPAMRIRNVKGIVIRQGEDNDFPAVTLINDPADPLRGATAPGTEMAATAQAGKSGEELTQLILNAVEPDSWQDAGGSGYLQLFNGILVVPQHDSAHRELDALLSDLRQTGAGDQ